MPNRYLTPFPVAQECPLDRVLYRQSLKFEKLSPSDQLAVRNSIGNSTENSLWAFASRSSIFALRNKDPNRIRAGLIALAMMPTEHDFRDVFMPLGLLSCAAKELDVDSTVFEEIAAMSEPHMAKLMQEMVGRDPSGTKSRNFIETEFGIGYVRADDGPYNPSSNLLAMGMRIAVAIEEVDPNYKANSFEIGSDTSPTYWLRSKELDTVAIQQQVTSAVQFRAKIDPKIAKYQRFVIDLYDLSSTETVKQLQAAADAKGVVNKESILAVSRENIFCIIGTSTYVKGVETNETNESLERFRNPINSLIHSETTHTLNSSK